ncbi:MAG: hypothetical protein JNM69_34815 [Archangium sp.]|nr:hypothetical protein [Archangium sp.]
MRPFVVRFAHAVLDVVPAGDELLVLTSSRLETLGQGLEPRSSTPLPNGHGSSLVVLADGRRLTGSTSFGELFVDGVPVTVGTEAYWSSFAPLGDGFVAWSQRHTLLDRRGERVVLARKTVLAKVAVWRDRVVFADWEKTELISPDGTVETLPGATMVAACGAHLALGSDEEGVIFYDGALREVARVGVGASLLQPWGDAVLASGAAGVACLTPDGAAWRWTCDEELAEPLIVGTRVLARSWSVQQAWLLDERGALEATLDLEGYATGAAPLGDGVVVTSTQGHEAVWWRPGGLERLSHDATPRLVGVLPTGVALAEGETLSVWRTDAEGPEPVVGASDLPLGAPLITAQGDVVLDAHGRFSSRGHAFNGLAVSITHGTPWRHALTAEQARPLLEALLARRSRPGALPSNDEWRAAEQECLVTSHSHFAAVEASLPLPTSATELGRALGVSARVIVAALRAGRFPLEPPQPVKGWEYLGAFETDGAVTVSDPCAIDSKHTSAPFMLALRLEVRPGEWHVFVRPGSAAHSDRTAELACLHADGFDTFADEALGSIGIDSGMAGMFDARCPRPVEGLEEGVHHGRCAVATTGVGDGSYPVFVGRAHGAVVKVRVHFLDPPAAELDTTFTPKSNGRAYSPKARYAVGDCLTHPTFGSGTVVGVRDRKADVRFADGVRVLVHAPA